MPVQVYIPTPYRAYTQGAAKVQIQANDVRTCLQTLSRAYPGLGERVLTPQGGVPGHLNVYVNDEEIRNLQGLDTPLAEGDEVALIPAMSGGRGSNVHPADAPVLTDEQFERYRRQIILPEVGLAGQRRLLDGKVLVVGAGGLGSPAAFYLAAAGVGTIGLVDGDRVDRTNLQRQILHTDADVGRPKVRSARRTLEALNPEVRVETYEEPLTAANAAAILSRYDVIVNGSDNFPTRYLVNDACYLLGKPLVDAAILRFEGQATVYLPGKGCYRCLYPAPPPPGTVPTCAEGGILGALAGHIGTLQASEALKLLLGAGEPLAGRTVIFDALAVEYRVLRWRRRPDCALCGDAPTIRELLDDEALCGVGGGTELPTAESTKTQPEPRSLDLAPAASWGEALDLDVREAALWVESPQVQWVDVRDPRVFRDEHIPGSRNLPLDRIGLLLDQIERSRPAIFVCEVGDRSRFVAETLREEGLLAYNLAGGLLAWKNRRLPLVGGEAGPP